MKAIILAGGKGTRMKELTANIPKPLIPINGRPFLGYILNTLIENRIKDIVVVVGYKGEKIKQFLRKWKDRFNHIEIVIQKEQLGTGHAVSLCKGFVDNFIILNGDSLFSANDIKKLIKRPFRQAVSGMFSDTPEKYGVLSGGYFLTKIIEKPTFFKRAQINVGLYKFDSTIFSFLHQITPSSRGELELTNAINLMTKKEMVCIHPVEYWKDLGCPEDIPLLENFLKEYGNNARTYVGRTS